MVPKGRQSVHQKAALSLQAGPTLTRALPWRFSAKYMALTVHVRFMSTHTCLVDSADRGSARAAATGLCIRAFLLLASTSWSPTGNRQKLPDGRQPLSGTRQPGSTLWLWQPEQGKRSVKGKGAGKGSRRRLFIMYQSLTDAKSTQTLVTLSTSGCTLPTAQLMPG